MDFAQGVPYLELNHEFEHLNVHGFTHQSLNIGPPALGLNTAYQRANGSVSMHVVHHADLPDVPEGDSDTMSEEPEGKSQGGSESESESEPMDGVEDYEPDYDEEEDYGETDDDEEEGDDEEEEDYEGEEEIEDNAAAETDSQTMDYSLEAPDLESPQGTYMNGAPTSPPTNTAPAFAKWWEQCESLFIDIEINHENIINLAKHINVDITMDSCEPIDIAWNNFNPLTLPPAEDTPDWSDVIEGYIEEKNQCEELLELINLDLKTIIQLRKKPQNMALLDHDDLEKEKRAICQLPELERKFAKMRIACNRLEGGWMYVYFNLERARTQAAPGSAGSGVRFAATPTGIFSPTWGEWQIWPGEREDSYCHSAAATPMGISSPTGWQKWPDERES
ncbi:hypothetical protein BGX38DRAFT_1277555 [Terfezia claveryi]|nr:hypothetical protein BGX38DRAFT_1277555 [Terfezia claveryi]